MPYVKTLDRNQMMMCSMNTFVDQDSIARLIDAFVDSLDMKKYSAKEVADEGRPQYDPRGMYKLYIYGNCEGIRSSRKLQKSCRVNNEVRWMMGGAEPDFRTISDFRKNNISSLKEIFREFNRRLSGAVEWGFTSIDGSKFTACNSKDRNFTANKLDDRITWLNAHTEEYLRILNEIDEQEDLDEESGVMTKEMIESKLKEARERLERYEGYRQILEDTGASQISLTDSDSRLMKNKNGFGMSYNPQTAVDSNTHLIRDYEMTNQVTDHGMLASTMENIKNESEDKIVEVVADKGYIDVKDMAECLENGIIPHVITEDGKDGYELEVSYEKSETDTESTRAEDIKKCLHAGQIPDVYKDVITDMEVKEVRRKVKEDTDSESPESRYGTPEEMKARAAEGYFVRDPERNIVYCPSGETLRQKSIKKNGNIRYANKLACRHCKNRNKCYKGKNEWKEIDFTKDKLEKPCTEWLKSEGKEAIKQDAENKKKSKYRKIKIVKFFLKPNREKMSHRMCLSEHPFGTIKRAIGSTYFLLKGMKKVDGEFALFCLGYNIKRARNLLGFDKMMEIMAG